MADDGGELVASGCDSARVQPLDEKRESGGIILGKLDGVEGRPPGSFSEAGSEVRRVVCEEASMEGPGFEVLAAADTHADDSSVLESRSSSIILFESVQWTRTHSRTRSEVQTPPLLISSSCGVDILRLS